MRGVQRWRPHAHLIELRGEQERMLLSLDEYQRWHEGYLLGVDGGLGMGTDRARPSDAPDTVGLVTTIHGGDTGVKVELEELPDNEETRERMRRFERNLHRPIQEALEDTEDESPAAYVASLIITVLHHADNAWGRRDAEGQLRLADALTLLRTDDPARAAIMNLLAACDPASGPIPELWPMRLVDLARTLEASAPDREALPPIAVYLRELAGE